MKSTRILVACAAALAFSGISHGAQFAISRLSTFGTNGWRAPNVVLTGDAAGSDSLSAGTYNYLQTNNLERGMAYNPVTGNLILVSRSSAGQGIRILDGQTGVDKGPLSFGSGVISGGTFTTSTVAVADDGAIYVANLTANYTNSAYKIYRWTNESSTPTTFYSGTMTNANSGFGGTPRLGDDLDVIGSGANTTLVAGVAGTTGYLVVTGSGAQPISSFSPTGPASGDYRLGITFGNDSTKVFGKQPSASGRYSTYTPGSSKVGAGGGSFSTISAGEAAMDFLSVDGQDYLAVLDMNNSVIRFYNVTNPSNVVNIIGTTGFPIAFTTTSGTLAGNGNATGSVKWGAQVNPADPYTYTLYAMSSNQGIQAFTVTVPEPGALGLLAVAPLALTRRRK